jgi:N-acetylneuraminic acid mutarotase
MNYARYRHTASILTNGQVLVAGGYNGNSYYLNSAELYNPSTGSWTSTGNMNNVRQSHTASTLTNGNVLVTGGFNGVYLNSAELYGST